MKRGQRSHDRTRIVREAHQQVDGRATVGVSHEKLTELADVARCSPFWTDWLEAFDELERA